MEPLPLPPDEPGPQTQPALEIVHPADTARTSHFNIRTVAGKLLLAAVALAIAVGAMLHYFRHQGSLPEERVRINREGHKAPHSVRKQTKAAPSKTGKSLTSKKKSSKATSLTKKSGKTKGKRKPWLSR